MFAATPEWFIPTVTKLCFQGCKTPSPVPIIFEASTSAALANQKLLEQFDCNISNLIQAHPNSCLSYGSEFRPVDDLETLLQLHPRWPKLKNLLVYGSCWPVSKIDDKTREEKILSSYYEEITNPLLLTVISSTSHYKKKSPKVG